MTAREWHRLLAALAAPLQAIYRVSACTQQRECEFHLSSSIRIDSSSLSGGALYTDVSYSVLPSSACNARWHSQHFDTLGRTLRLHSTFIVCRGSLTLMKQ